MIFTELADYSDFSWIIALGIIIGLSIFMTIILESTFKTFFIFTLIFSGFCFYGGLIDLWIIILLMILNTFILLLDLDINSGLIMSTLTIMFVLVVFNIILGGGYITSEPTTMIIDTNILIDGVSSTYEAESDAYIFEISELEGMIILLTTITTIATFTGIQVLGSGLSDSSVHTLVIVAIFSGIWIILSVLVAPLVWSIEIFGTLIYVLLTIAYAIGVVQKVVAF